MSLQFKRSSEGLPFFVREPAKKRFGFTRWWRSIPRLKRSLLVMLFVSCILLILYVFKTASSADPSLVDHINKNHIEAIQQNGEHVRPDAADNVADHVDIAADGDADGKNVVEPPKLNHRRIPNFAGPQNDRQRAVVTAFQHAWKGYKDYAWGHDQLKPISEGYSDWFDCGLTIVDSIDTAMIMGLKQEVEDGTAWIKDKLSFDKNRYVNLFEITIRGLGGLLSAFHLTGDQMFIDRSVDLANRLTGAFTHSKSAVPLSDVNLQTGDAKAPSWSAESSLSEVTSLQLEFRDLSRITGNKSYEELAFKVSEHVHEIGCAGHDGLCEMFINTNTGKFKERTTISFGARSDSYYEYLFKQWLQTGKKIDWLLDDYKKAMDSMESKLLRYSEPNKLAFVGELLPGDTFSPKMDHLVCFLAGTLALGSKNGLPANHLDIAKGLGAACHAMYLNPTGLGPEIAHYNMLPGSTDDLLIKPLDAHSLLRPEAIEAWFYLYRLTGDKVYQDWGWKAFQAIEKYAKVEHGYSSVNSVKKIPVTYRDLMESFYLAETLKYLYLLFADEQTDLPLDQWVFNTEAHPMPIYDH